MQQQPKKIVVMSGIVIPEGTIVHKAPVVGMKYRRMLKFCQEVHPHWVKWTYPSQEECQNAVRYLRYFFKDRDQVELQTPRKAMMRMARGCFILMKAKSSGVVSRNP
jgi:hypothetical protein